MNEPPWSGLEVLAQVDEAQSFRGAAVRLGISPSAVSHRIKTLEQAVGVRVLNRTTRSLALTPAGDALLGAYLPAREAVTQALSGLDERADDVRGSLRINAPSLACRHILPPILFALSARHPGVEVELVSSNALVDIVAEGFDAGVRLPDQLPADMIARPLSTPIRFIVVGSPSYLREHAAPKVPSELLAHRCIGLRFPSGKVYAWGFERDGQVQRIRAPWALMVSDTVHSLSAAAAGLGLAFVYELDAAGAIERGELVEVLAGWRPEEPGFCLYYPSRKIQRRPLVALVALVARLSSAPGA